MIRSGGACANCQRGRWKSGGPPYTYPSHIFRKNLTPPIPNSTPLHFSSPFHPRAASFNTLACFPGPSTTAFAPPLFPASTAAATLPSSSYSYHTPLTARFSFLGPGRIRVVQGGEGETERSADVDVDVADCTLAVSDAAAAARPWEQRCATAVAIWSTARVTSAAERCCCVASAATWVAVALSMVCVSVCAA